MGPQGPPGGRNGRRCKLEVEAITTGRSRQLFPRRGHGLYALNPGLAVRVDESGGEGRWELITKIINEPLRVRSALMHEERISKLDPRRRF